MENKKLAVVLIVGLAIGAFATTAMQPKRPFLNWMGKAVRSVLFIAPFVLDEPPPEVRYQTAIGNYSDIPERPKAQDGYAVIKHGENW